MLRCGGRWTRDLAQLYEDKKQRLGNCLLSAAFLSYTGPFSAEYRQEMVWNDWQASLLEKEVPLTQPWRVQDQLTSDVEISRCAREHESLHLLFDFFLFRNLCW